jgi:phage terminase small subunit
MENIYEPNAKFSFDKLQLSKPIAVTGGNYFIRFKINDYPLYIKSPKCNTKQGILKAGKKLFSDLMFSNENEEFIHWMETLENYSQKYIYDHRKEWFETELDMHDIENSFAPLLKVYKSGKYYLARANVPCIMGKCSLKIYDERENEVDYDTISNNENVITILEIQGIKCSARSFQIEIEIKQMLVLKPEKIFEKCILIKSPQPITQEPETFSNIQEEKEKCVQEFEVPIMTDTELLVNISAEDTLDNKNDEEEPVMVENPPPPPSEEIFSNNSEIINEPVEVDFNLDELNENDTIQLKNRNDVYYKMYREARKKAKMAKDLAMASYLEAKRIKNTYMLEDVSDSDLESDLEDYEK